MSTNRERTPAPDMSSLSMNIAGIIETFLEVGILTHDFEGTSDAKSALIDRINKVVEQMNGLNTEISAESSPNNGNDANGDAKNVNNSPGSLMVPLDVIEYIENGRNPDVYTREFVEVLAKQNQYTKGQMAALAKFQTLLASHLSETYPETKSSIERIVESTKK